MTTCAVALAAVWPEPAVLVEVDCAGGDLGGWFWVPDSPGVASLATACRTGRVDLAAHVTSLPCGVDAVVAAAGGHPATVAVGLLGEADPALWAKERPVIADVGRLDPGAPSWAIVASADVLLVCSRGDEASLLRLADADLPAATARVVLVGGSRYRHGEITARTGLPVAAAVPWDVHAAQVICGRRPARRGWTRRGLPAAARALAGDLAASSTDGTRRRG
ncbi:MAG: hypothetical protein GEV12_19855 [Micromonosporaceae bacterium]|nr:hypothetical protein [Micromonosporaceae bacterium]